MTSSAPTSRSSHSCWSRLSRRLGMRLSFCRGRCGHGTPRSSPGKIDHVPTWQEFRQAFWAHYILASLMEQKQREFRELKQGNRMVMQYVQSFIHLSQYAPEDVADDPRRAARLLHGLDPTLQTHLGRRYESFTDLVDTALDMESRVSPKRIRNASVRLTAHLLAPHRSRGPTTSNPRGFSSNLAL